ncbi:MAG: hypothetical protein R3F43_09605 [bacterium]
MRVELKNGEQAIALMSEEGLIQFRDEGEVRMVLRLFSGSPGTWPRCASSSPRSWARSPRSP